MLTPQQLELLEDRLQEAICPVCIERDVRGTCRLWELDECPISRHLPRLVEIAESVDSNLISDYIPAVRENICTTCQGSLQSPGKSCSVREQGHCALDAYLPLILEVMDDFLSQQAGEAEGGRNGVVQQQL